jgi:NADH-quinone oxidoreductase subunit L
MNPVAALTPLETILKYPGPWLAWILPMIGALTMPLFERLGHKIRDYAAVAWGFTSVVSAASMVPWLFNGNWPGDIKLTTWITFPGGHPLEVGVLVDPLSIIICNVVAFISFLILVYSTEYMHGDKHLTRFWFFFLYFVGSMLLLVLSDNLIQTMVGWEGVGICSFGLIGYYYRDAKERWLGGPPPHKMFPPSHAGMKAFVVTGIGDVFILGAIFVIFNYAGTLNYVELIETAHHWLPQIAAVPGLLAITAIFFLGGPIGKSAQFPLHEWLPEAMAGPTSVSALIHAATMVKAGVYLVARMSPIFYLGTWEMHIPEAQVFFIVIACVGAFTCFMAASQALVSADRLHDAGPRYLRPE